MKTKPSCTPTKKLEEDCYDWYERHGEKCAEAARGSHDVIFIGDSITHFWEKANGSRVWSKYFGGKSVMNLGFGWDRTCNVLWRIANGELASQSPKMFVINIGTNNFAKTAAYPGDSPEDIADGTIAIVDELRRRFPETGITIMSIFQRDKNPSSYRDRIRATNSLVKARLNGRDRVKVMDISESFMLPDGSDLDASYFCDGGTHPNEKGYAVWAEAIWPVVGPLLCGGTAGK